MRVRKISQRSQKSTHRDQSQPECMETTRADTQFLEMLMSIPKNDKFAQRRQRNQKLRILYVPFYIFGVS